jgi:hypothetical protein
VRTQLDQSGDVTILCRLTPGGTAKADEAAIEWVQRVTDLVRTQTASAALTLHLWAYRVDGQECLSCDIYDETTSKNGVAVTFLPGHQSDLRDPTEPLVADMADALHMAGSLARALKATVVLGR